MTMRVKVKRTPGMSYGNVLVNGSGQRDHIKLDLSTFTLDEIDGDGYLKPGVPVKQDGTRINGAGQVAHGVTPEALPLPVNTPASNASLALETADPLVGVVTDGLINRDIAKSNYGRDYNANELAALAAGGFKVTTT